MTSTDPLSESFVCLVSGHAGCTREAIGDARRGSNLAAATMARCALRLPRGTVTEAAVEAGALAMFAEEQCDRHQKSTPQLLRENWEGRLSEREQDEYRSLSRVVLEATSEVRPRGTVTDAEVQCPHWSPGSVAKRTGCTACAAEARNA